MDDETKITNKSLRKIERMLNQTINNLLFDDTIDPDWLELSAASGASHQPRAGGC